MGPPVNAATPSTASSAGEDMLTNDQRFLLTVIFGLYFGPHLQGERPPHKSALQRVLERLPRYTQDRLAGSKLMVAQMIHVYYYILRKASQSVIVAPPLLLKFFRDALPPRMLGPGFNYPLFIDLFPTDLHPCSRVEERFMEFVLEKDAAKLPIYVTDEVFYQVIAREERSEGQPHFSVPHCGSHGRQCNISMAFSPLDTTGATAAWSAGAGVVWNAEVELAGSITGRVTLAESEDSYLFNVSLPGIRIDQSFSCEFDMDGEVLIEGEIATGGNTVESRTGNPCQPGHFLSVFSCLVVSISEAPTATFAQMGLSKEGRRNRSKIDDLQAAWFLF
ncbi:increased DNA methylation 2-like [Eucalyptus grandis]|uniref:increased DNA methylation 2-like n=1 Tax=Eucalyptus grandis TaxID=71139 RepID=UPI00192ECFD3|nr:increased DNA methylation 2-like [Eucalyptus grandis]